MGCCVQFTPMTTAARLILILATIVMASYGFYATMPLGAETPAVLDTGSLVVFAATTIGWLAPYYWWCHQYDRSNQR